MVTTCDGAVHGGHREAVRQSVAGTERLHRGIAVVQRVGPHAGRCQRVAAVAAGACDCRGDRGPAIVRIVDVGGIEVAGRNRGAWNAGTNSAGLDHRAGHGAGDHRRIVGAVDGDGDELRGAVDRRGGEGVDQCLPDIERLHRGVAVVERVGPGAIRCQRVGAVAADAGGAGRYRLPAVGWIVDISGAEIACDCRRAGRAVIDPAGLDHRAGHGAGNHRRIVGAVDGDGDDLRRAVDRRGGEGVGQRLPDIERLHGRVGCC